MKIDNFQFVETEDGKRVSANVSWEDSNRHTQEIYFETSKAFGGGLTCNPHAFLVACIMPAMHNGERRIFIDAEIDPVLENGLYVVMNWFQNWFEVDREIVHIEAKGKRTRYMSGNARNAAVFLSGGIDSLATLRHNHMNFPTDHPWRIRDAIFVRGQNIESDIRLETFQKALDVLSVVCSDSGISLIPVMTNIRELEPDTQFFLKEFQAAILAAVAHAFVKRISVAYISASESIPSSLKFNKTRHFLPYGTHPLIDPNYGCSELLIRYVSAELTRLEKTKIVADWNVGLQSIKVCPANWPGDNCGHCEKCIRTMLGLLVLDKLSNTSAFPGEDISESALSDIHIEKQRTPNGYSVEADYLELIPELERKERKDLVRAIEQIISKARYREPARVKERMKKLDNEYLGGAITKLKRFFFS